MKRVITIVVLLIGLGTLFFFTLKKKPPKTSDEYNDAINDKVSYLDNITYDINIDKEMANKIIEYMDIYYKAMKDLEIVDMTNLFVDKDSDAALINQTALELLIESRLLKKQDLKLDNVSYDLRIMNVVNIDDTIVVTVNESNTLKFHFLEGIESKVYNIENTFVFKKIDNDYKIVDYDKVQDFFVMITDYYENGGLIRLNEIKNTHIETIKNNLKKVETPLTDKTCKYSYNREKALEYAQKWVNKRNPKWTSFDANCQNYASQVLYAGGIPMDYTGSADEFLQWKFYSSSYNEQEIGKGYVYTWTSVTRFYKYAKNNIGSGLCATVDAPLSTSLPGDIIQVGTEGATRHTLVVIDKYEKNNISDILVNSNTVDLENYPLSAYTYPYMSLIKIHGYN